MAKILNASFNVSAPVSLLNTKIARTIRALFHVAPEHDTGRLTQRLRYDVGELDVNPDLVRRSRRMSEYAIDREIMRRDF